MSAPTPNKRRAASSPCSFFPPLIRATRRHRPRFKYSLLLLRRYLRASNRAKTLVLLPSRDLHCHPSRRISGFRPPGSKTLTARSREIRHTTVRCRNVLQRDSVYHLKLDEGNRWIGRVALGGTVGQGRLSTTHHWMSLTFWRSGRRCHVTAGRGQTHDEQLSAVRLINSRGTVVSPVLKLCYYSASSQANYIHECSTVFVVA